MTVNACTANRMTVTATSEPDDDGHDYGREQNGADREGHELLHGATFGQMQFQVQTRSAVLDLPLPIAP